MTPYYNSKNYYDYQRASDTIHDASATSQLITQESRFKVSRNREKEEPRSATTIELSQPREPSQQNIFTSMDNANAPSRLNRDDSRQDNYNKKVYRMNLIDADQVVNSSELSNNVNTNITTQNQNTLDN